MRLLWLLSKAAPALLRHMVAYVDLASVDLARAHREIAAQAVASVIILVSGFLGLFMGCLAVVAYTWDTPHRVSAIPGWATDSCCWPSWRPYAGPTPFEPDRRFSVRFARHGMKIASFSSA